MLFAIAAHGTRGDIEPCTALGLEMSRRGHEVRMAVPPNLIGFVESAGLHAVAYGPDSQQQLDSEFFREFWRIQNPVALIRAGREYLAQGWAEMSATLVSLADGADLLMTATTYQEVAANVAEHYNIPSAALHYFPLRANGHIAFPGLPFPAPVIRSATSAIWWLHWQMTREVENRQRRELGLPEASTTSGERSMRRGALEIQAYDKVCFPGLAQEWAGSRPFVGALTLQLDTEADDEVMAWAKAGTPPIYFGFGSMPLDTPEDTITMIASVCAQLGERALICSNRLAGTSFTGGMANDRTKVVAAVKHAVVFPACKAVVHHGGAGTTAAGMRAGVPTLVLWVGADQPIWAAAVKRLGVGESGRLNGTTPTSLAADLRRILRQGCVDRAHEVASQLTTPHESVDAAAHLLERQLVSQV
ncbi:glycosyltransferase [Mycolicibacterium stellerae]|uniref:glycosyltransferase n=1 Tax=Mycolicibacterium stellerae TaxID=2358193 RepID=UPI000F0B1559|nr:glycosyltransferase [Mycolicibacterium stellerae]